MIAFSTRPAMNWELITRLGEAQILVPAALLAALAMLRELAARPRVAVWLGGLALVTAITAATKIAFIGWGLGSARLDFTGVSGHAMFATAIYPVLGHRLGANLRGSASTWGAALGFALAAVVGVSRVALGAHSWSEVIAGWLLGGAATLGVLARDAQRGIPPVWAAVLVAWLLVMPAGGPPSRAHSLVVRLSLALSGRDTPYTRADLHRAWRAAEGVRARALDARASIRS
jgi:membrane-associated phospholipid phosphatase